MTDDLIERALRGEASEAELAELVGWRRASPEHEQHYRRTERLIAAARTLRADPVAPRPSAALIIAGSAAGGMAARALVVARRSRLERAAPWAVAAAAVLVAVLNLGDRGSPPAGAPAEVVTGSTELATVKLGDGTVIRLAPSSRLQFAGTASPGEDGGREVTLDGRAFFVVAKQPAERPF
ncbi:MAG: DUF4880 domain-containing protein, partial [Longimicrobiales bacterium]